MENTDTDTEYKEIVLVRLMKVIDELDIQGYFIDSKKSKVVENISSKLINLIKKINKEGL